MPEYDGWLVTQSQVYSLSVLGGQYPLGEHFRLREFACADGSDVVIVHPALVMLLDQIRSYYGVPLTINSAYRSHQHNRAVGISPQSRHLWGMAADIVVRDVPASVVASYADLLGAGGVGRYATFTHVDVQGVMRRWG